MKQKYTLIEGNDALNKTLLMMRYDLSKTLNENLVDEQTQNNKNSFFLQNQPSGKKPTNTKGMIPGFEKVKSSITQEDFEKFVYENRHGLLDIAAIGAAFIPLVGPFISLGLELGNAALYASEGDKYSAGLALAFTLIPGGKIPAVKKLGRNGLAALLKKAKNPKLVKTLSNAEKETLEQINKNSKWVTLTASKELSRKIAKISIKKMSLPQLVKFVYSFSKKYPKIYDITTMGLQIGGIWYSYDKLAEIYGIKPISPEVNKQNKSQINPKELELKYNENKDKIEEQIVKSLTGGLTDEQLNMEFQKRLGDDITFD